MNLRQYLAYPDRRLAAQAAVGAALSKAGTQLLRKRLPPSLAELAAVTPRVHGDAAELIADADWLTSELSNGRLPVLVEEHRVLARALEQRHASRALVFPPRWAVEAETSLLLYVLVRALRPSLVIEMGVANGQSSYFILNALRANETGLLRSFDVEPDVGSLLAEEERAAWSVGLIDRRDTVASLEQHLAPLPPADICFHDADHGYLAQYYEFTRLWSQLSDRGVLIGDDVDASYGFIDFCRNQGLQAEILIDGRKAVGVVPQLAAHPHRG